MPIKPGNMASDQWLQHRAFNLPAQTLRRMAADPELGLQDKLAAAHEKHPASGGQRPDDEGAMLPRSAWPALAEHAVDQQTVVSHVAKGPWCLESWCRESSCRPRLCIVKS